MASTEIAPVESLPDTGEQAVETVKEQILHYIDAFATADAYIELLILSVSAGISFLLALLVQRLITKRYKPMLEADNLTWLLKPLRLLAPLFVIISISVSAPLLAHFVQEPVFLYPFAQIAVAWLLVQLVWMTIKNTVMAWFISLVLIVIITLNAFGLLTPISSYLESLGFSISTYEFTMLGILQGIIICIVVFWLAMVSSGLAERYIHGSTRLSYNARELIVKFLKIFIFAIAILSTLSAVGVDLTALAVFGGALGIGIGLGLQQITSNFVAGVSLLLEKAVQQGDMVEIDGVMGYVREINVRSTMIETFAGQEVAIPNEKLVTGNIINWTHSNRNGRIEILVGVAYGSDYRLVQKLLTQAASEHPKCLKDPEVKCYMNTFGESSVDFRLMFWVANIADGLFGPQSDVMFRITELFDEHGIVIPFPQRDIHIIRDGSEAPAGQA